MQESVEFANPLPADVQLNIMSIVGGRPAGAGNVPFPVTVGESGQHTAQASVPVSGVSWTITGGNPIAGYMVTRTLGQVLPLMPAALQQNPLSFVFTTPGFWTVTATIRTQSGVGRVTRTFEVQAPQVNFFESQTGQVGVHTMNGSQMLMFGTPAAHGIVMNAVVFGQQNVPGQVGILQLATNQRFGSDAQHRLYHNTQNGMAALDVGPHGGYTFYQGVISPLPLDGNAQVLVNDRPAQGLGADMVLVAIGDGNPVVPERYQAFLMFQASSPGAVWVPLSVLTWTWEGFSQMQANGTWGPVQAPGNAVNPAGVPTNQFPQWALNTTTGVMVPE